MANKKNKKEEEFNKLVDEEDMDYEDYSSDSEFNLVNEIKGLKILTCISICITIVSLLISLVVLSKVSGTDTYSSGNGSGSGQDNTDQGINSEVEYDVSMFTEISFDDFMEMYKEDKHYFVYTGRSTCGYCVAFLPALQQSVSEYDYTLYYLDIDKLDNDDLSEIAELHSKFETTIGATPMVYYMGKKNVVAVNEGYTEYETYAKFLENNGVKKRK